MEGKKKEEAEPQRFNSKNRPPALPKSKYVPSTRRPSLEPGLATGKGTWGDFSQILRPLKSIFVV